MSQWPASVNPVAVGDASSGPSTTVSFSVDVTSGNERNEAGPIKIKSQTYTINASPGVITGVSHPTGYTPKIATGGGSATVTGNGASSFDIAVTVYYPPSAAGFNTVSCTGKLTMTDNTPIPGNTANSSLTAVKVDSVALAIDPTKVKIGQTLKRSDFTITTTPSGKGDYKYADGSYLVAFPSSLKVQIGDNPAKATCGVSSATDTLIGINVSVAWGNVEDYNGDTNQVKVSYSAEVQGDANTTASVTFSGPNSPVSGDVNPTLTPNQPFSGTVWLQGPSSSYTGTTDDDLSIQASESNPQQPVMSSPAAFTTATTGGGVAAGIKTTVGLLNFMKSAVTKGSQAVVRPTAASTKPGIPLSLQAFNGATYISVATGKQVVSATTTCYGVAGGKGWTFLILKMDAYATPESEAGVYKPAPQTVQKKLQNNNLGPVESFQVLADTPQGNPSTNGVLFGNNATPSWFATPPSNPIAGPSNTTVVADSLANGGNWKVSSSTMTGELEPPTYFNKATGKTVSDGNWGYQQAGNPDKVSLDYIWFP